ncbi:WecB/TagA/CpsF family glycosyltransferase [Microcoleus sp. MON1_C5]|uniref:WecB/TagA/CpsF family glycosyltransferase n=1 Tax=Microcoleus sp. MON1_C5 TaxID=2818828 RepID=UPI002FCEB726
MQKVKVLNICIDNLSTIELLQQLDERGGIVFTPNVDHLMILQKDIDFYNAYKFADYRVCDGQILMYCLQLLGTPIQEKISGSDLLPTFYQYHKNNQNIKIFLLGAAPGVADQARKNINLKVGREIVVGAHSPSFGFEKNEEECTAIVDLIEQSGANVLAVGVGAPKQEKWIIKYKEKLKSIKIFLAIGATIDFEAGHKKRAPKWMSNAGLETPYRLLSEPRRLWKRYLINDPPFLGLAFKQKINIYQNPFTDW